MFGLERGYCLMVGGARRRGRAAGTDLRRARARASTRRRAPRRWPARRRAEHRRARLAALRPDRRRPLREDGAQRHRVRADGRVRRGAERAGQGRRRQRGPRRGRRDGAARPTRSTTSTTSTWRAIAEVWRRGSVVASWLLDLTADALRRRSRAERVRGPRQRLRRGPLDACTPPSTRACPVPVLAAALFERFTSRGRADVADKVLSAMRSEFGGHVERKDEHSMNGDRPDGPATSRRPTPSCCSARPATSPSASCSPPCTTLERRGELKVPGHRRGAQRLDRRRLPRARPRVDRRQRRGRYDEDVIRDLLRSGSTSSRATTPTRRRGSRSPTRSTSTDRRSPCSTWRSRRHVPDGRRVAGVGRPQRARPDRRREAVRPRPGVGARAERHAARGVPRGAHLPHRPLPRQGERRGPARVPLLEHAARAGVEPQLRPQRADHDGRDDRRRGSRQLLRRRRRDPRRPAEPPAAGRRAVGDGAAGRTRAVVPAGREGQGVRGDASRSIRSAWCAGSTSATATSRASTPTRPSRRSSPRGWRSTRGAGPACRGTSASARRCRTP